MSLSTTTTTTTETLSPDIEDLHHAACRNGDKIYIDPHTGLSCWTEVAHLQRGVCCGRQCRHCPYGWENVHHHRANHHRPAKLKSKDKTRARELLREYGIVDRTEEEDEDLSTDDDESDEEEQECSSCCNVTTTTTSTILATASTTGGALGGIGTSKNVPYTRAGDQGASLLPSGQWKSKADDRVFAAMGTVDELCSVVGVCHAILVEQKNSNDDDNDSSVLCEWLVDVMSRLFDIGSQLAVEDAIVFFDQDAAVVQLEEWIDTMTEDLPELTSFVLPTGSVAAAHLHVARTVCRRAERLCAPHPYLNRLSDFLFTAARHVNHRRRRRRHKQQLSNGKNDDDDAVPPSGEWMYRKPHATAAQRQVVGPGGQEKKNETDAQTDR